MLNFLSNKPVRFCDGVSRRDFLRVGTLSAGAVGLSLAHVPAATTNADAGLNCILLFLVGGPSHLDTWDPKPDAPEHIRGPFRAIPTNVTGIRIGEHFPLMSRVADRFALVRSVHHPAAPIHETGQQLLQTGHLFQGDLEYPHYGATISHLCGPGRGGLPPFVVLPGFIDNTGVNVSHGQGAGYLGAQHEPFALRADPNSPNFQITNINAPAGIDPARLRNRRELLDAIDHAQRTFDATQARQTGNNGHQQAFNLIFAQNVRRAFDIGSEHAPLRDRYGRNTFGQSCLLARRLVEHGVRFVTVNMFDTVFNNITWDCHADGGSLAVTLDDYRATLCPMFDRAYTALLEDLRQRGLLDTTMVVAMGEFGRTPQLNARGGRDHWPGVWSVLFAGGRVRGGRVIGSSDRHGTEPRDRPVSPAEIAATVYQGVGVDLQTRLPGPEQRLLPLTEAKPVDELFRA